MKIAVIGAGIASAVFCDAVKDRNFEITVFEKSRGIGGRMSTRYSEHHEFDHGAQFFTARTAEFQRFVTELQDHGLVCEWTPKVTTLAPGEKPYGRPWFEPHYIATPRMNSLAKHLLEPFEVRRGIRVTEIDTQSGQHELLDENAASLGKFDWVISTAPAEQTEALIPSSQADLRKVRFEPCFALMIEWPFEALNWQVARAKNTSIDWLCFNQFRPGRHTQPSLLVHSTGTWAANHYDNVDDAKILLTRDLEELLAVDLSRANSTIHRWRYSRTTAPLGAPYWLDRTQQLAAIGDWCIGSNIEDAYRSASEFAAALTART